MNGKHPLVVGLILLLAAGAASPAWARRAAAPPRARAAAEPEAAVFLNAATFDPVGFAFGNANLEYSRLVLPSQVAAARLVFGDGFGAGASWRYYPLRDVPAPEGFWVGAGADLYGYQYHFNGQSATGLFCLSVGEAGYRVLFPLSDDLAFVLTPSLALGFNLGTVSAGGRTYNGGFYFGLGLALGLAF